MKFSDFVATDAIRSHVDADTKEGVIREMTRALVNAGKIAAGDEESIIKAILKRTERSDGTSAEQEFSIGTYRFNPMLNQLIHNGNVHKLTSKEVELLKLLCQHKNDTLERNFAFLNRNAEE